MSISNNSKNKNHSKERQKFEQLLNGLISMLCQQRSHIDILLEDRDSIAQRYQILHHRWVSDLCLSRDQVSMLQRQISLSELSKSVEKVKADLVLGLKERKALISQRKLESLGTELDDFKTLFGIRSRGCPSQQDISPDKLYRSLKAEGLRERSPHGSSELVEEVAMLKREYEKVSLQYSCSASALDAERKFVWNQFKEMESKYIEQLQTKKNEIHEANEEVKKLLVVIEQLHSSMAEKDEVVKMLRANITKMEGEANKKDTETASLTKELESAKSPSSARLPVFKRCSSKPLSSSGSTVRRSSKKRMSIAPQEEAYSKRLKIDEVIKLGAKSIDSMKDTDQKIAESSTISKELQSSRLKNDSDTPMLKHCKGELLSNSSGRKTRRNRSAVSPFELVADQVSDSMPPSFDHLTAFSMTDTNQKNTESSTISKELQSSRLENDSDIHLLKHCKGKLSSKPRGTKTRRNKRSATSPLELDAEQGLGR